MGHINFYAQYAASLAAIQNEAMRITPPTVTPRAEVDDAMWLADLGILSVLTLKDK